MPRTTRFEVPRLGISSVEPRPPVARPRRSAQRVLPLLLALAGVAALTLSPRGDGWAWGAPVVELRWYADGLDSPATVLQLLGNVLLLVPATVLAVLLHPRLAVPLLLVPVAVATGAAIEVLQWWLPLGRVVSPVDAVLNAGGAVVSGLVTGRVVGARPAAT